MSELTYRPTYGAEMAKKPKLLEAAFGDGYTQRTADGINNNPEVWSITFSNVNDTLAASILSFFETQGGYTPFEWVNLHGVKKNYVCREWNASHNSEDSTTITAKLEQYYG